MKVSIGSDHGGFLLKEKVIGFLKNQNVEVLDCGCDSLDSVDYPIYAQKVCKKVQSKDVDFGILICTTGIGMSMCANKFRGIRAALVSSTLGSINCRLHNNANVLCMGAKEVTEEEAYQYVFNFLKTEFEGGRHCRRVDLITKMEESEWEN